MNWFYSLIIYFLYIINGAMALFAGVPLILLGIMVIHAKSSILLIAKITGTTMFDDLKANIGDGLPSFASVGTLIIIIGSVLYVLAAVQIFGIHYRYRRFMILYMVVIILVIFLELVTFYYFIFRDEQIFKPLVVKLKRSLQHYNGNENDNFMTMFWNGIQTYFQCCGVINGTDYNTKSFLNTELTYPPTCCTLSEGKVPDVFTWKDLIQPDTTAYLYGNCTFQKLDESTLAVVSNYHVGCLTKFIQFLKDNFSPSVMSAIAVILSQIMLIQFQILLYIKFLENRRSPDAKHIRNGFKNAKRIKVVEDN